MSDINSAIMINAWSLEGRVEVDKKFFSYAIYLLKK